MRWATPPSPRWLARVAASPRTRAPLAGLLVVALAATVAWAVAGRGPLTRPRPIPSAVARVPVASEAVRPTSTPSPSPPCVGVVVSPGAALQAVVDANPARSTFCFATGTYRADSLSPKAGDILDGANRSAVLDGADAVEHAILGTPAAPNVTVQGFTIQHYRSPLQHGAIESFGTSGWLIQDNHVTLNRGAGITADTGARVVRNLLDWNGQEGFSIHGDDVLLEGNEIAHNNPMLAVNPGWEAGGGKIWATRRAAVLQNNVHDNGGPGLWTDGGCIDTLYASNTVTANWGPGIFHEVSYDAVITGNTVKGNGFGDHGGWLWDSGILIAASGSLSATSPLDVSHNTVIDNYNGIGLIQQDRGSGPFGPFLVQNVFVHDNAVSMARGASGAVQDVGDPGLFGRRHNRFAANVYTVRSTGDSAFAWGDGFIGWQAWRALGEDIRGAYS